MILRRLIGLAMIGVEVVVLYRTMGYLPIGLLALLVACVGCFPALTLDWNFRRKFFSALGIAACYWLWWRFDLRQMEPSRSAQFAKNFALAASLGLMMMQALQFYWKDKRGLPNYYPFLGALSLAFATDHYITNPAERPLIFGLVMGFGVLLALFYGTETGGSGSAKKVHRGYRLALLTCCFTLSILLAAGTAWVLSHSEQAVGQWLANQTFVQNKLVLGNQSTARLGSTSHIKGDNFDRIALQIVADESPGYLRGQVYDKFEANSWSAVGSGNAADNPEEIPAYYTPEWSDESLYVVTPTAEAVYGEMVIYPDDRIDRAMFTPGDTGWVGSQYGYLIVNEARVVQASSELLGRPYHVLTTVETTIEALTPEAYDLYIQLPPDLEPRLRELAAQIVGEQTSVLGKANVITQYFTSNYDYVLGIDVPQGKDPMEYFLFSDPLPDGHCEFFATGAVLLLRASGVPARYVTGVGVWEQHPFADYWVARNRDAHAWVEAWDPEEGWFIVEPTPASGLPNGSTAQAAGGFRDFWSMLSLTVRRFIVAVKEGAWTTLTNLLQTVVWGVLAFLQWAWWMVVAVGIIVVLLWELRQRLRKGGWRKGPVREGTQQQLQEQISGMDRWVYKQLRLRRAAHTTAHAFARELEASSDHDEKQRGLAQWYRRWATLRYRSTPSPEDVEALESTRKALQKKELPRGARS